MSVGQNRYLTLCSDFATRLADLQEWQSNARRLVYTFCSEFTSYLGCPEQFEDVSGRKLSVVAVARLTEHDDEPDIIPLEETSVNGDVIVLNGNIEWVFALRIYLSGQVDNHFKKAFVCRCRFTIDGNNAHLRVGDQEKPLTLNLEDVASFGPALDAVYNHLRNYLQRRPVAGTRKPQMGFAIREDI